MIKFDYAEEGQWPTAELEAHVAEMQAEYPEAIAHRREFLYRALGYAGFELHMREQEMQEFERGIQPES